MLKFIFWGLILANAMLFAYQRGYLGAWGSDVHQPARVAQQFNPDKMKPIPAGAIAAAPPDIALASSAETKPEANACTEVGNFDVATAKRFETQLLPLALGDKLSRREIQEAARNMVYIPSQGSKEVADKKAAELRRLGISDFYIIQDAGELHWGISLGIFKTEGAARAQLTALNLKGIHSARLAAHNAGANKVAFQLRNLSAEAKAGLDKITLEFPHAEMHSCELDSAADNHAAAHAVKETFSRDAVH